MNASSCHQQKQKKTEWSANINDNKIIIYQLSNKFYNIALKFEYFLYIYKTFSFKKELHSLKFSMNIQFTLVYKDMISSKNSYLQKENLLNFLYCLCDFKKIICIK